MLEKKNILMFSNAFFNYENLIIEKLEENGASVDFFNERPSNNLFVKAIIRVKKKLLERFIENYYKKIISKIQYNKYDIFFVIKGEVVPRFFIEKVIELNPNIEMFYYNYDSFGNNPNGLQILPLFHHKYTFDLKDAEKYNLIFRPLFCSDIYQKKIANDTANLYDVLFIGTAHSDRYVIAENIKKNIIKFNRRSYNYYYIQSKWVYWYKKKFDSTFADFDFKELSFKKLSHLEILKLYQKSISILDINHPNQEGLTMRTFEALGAGKKLITTNTSILKYEFYNPNNVLVIDRNDIHIDNSFFNTPFLGYSKAILHSISLDGWIEDIFEKKRSYIIS